MIGMYINKMFYNIKLAQKNYLDILQIHLDVDAKKLKALLLSLKNFDNKQVSSNSYFYKAVLVIWLYCASHNMESLFYQSYQDIIKFKKIRGAKLNKRLNWFCSALTEMVWSCLSGNLTNLPSKGLLDFNNMFLSFKSLIPQKHQESERYFLAGGNN